MKPSVYFADLRYNFSGFLANDCMPLGVAYMKAVMDRDLPREVESRLFVYPDRLLETMRSDPPAVLMLSNYVWNEALSLHLAKQARKINPGMLTVMGGPNISLEPGRQISWFEKTPELDVYVLGEADFLATELVRRYLNAGLDRAKFFAGEMPSSLYRRPDGTVVRGAGWERHKEIDEIPSPWLTGIQDEFFDGKLAPMIETNRGCPFTCTFCVQGTRWYTKVHNFSIDRVKEEVDYIAKRIHAVSPQMGTLRIADSNYGMYERDVEISSFIGECMKRYNYPKYIDATTGKNRPERIIQSVEKVSGALVIYQAVQSLDENVLRNVKRQTIKLEAYEQLQVHMRGRGLRSNSDLILCLPGETVDTHLAASRKLLNSGISQVTNFQLMMLKGSELETEETRRMFSFVSRFRLLPKNFGLYGDEKVFDVEEIVVATDSLSFEDYITCRKHALCSVAFWRDDVFQDVTEFLGRCGGQRSDCWDAMYEELDHSTGGVRSYLEDFVRETKGELFESREACLDFYGKEENFQRLLQGEVGDNLMHKYHALASFYLWPEVCQVGMDALKKVALARGVPEQMEDFDRFWENLREFLNLRHAHGRTEAEILSDRRGIFQYDIARWLADGMPLATRPYLLEQPVEIEFRLSSEGRAGLDAALKVWSANIKGLTKMVNRIQRAWLVREPQSISVAVSG